METVKFQNRKTQAFQLSEPASFIHDISIPAVIITNNQLVAFNDAFADRVTKEYFLAPKTSQRIKQVLNNMSIVNDMLRFELSNNSKTFSCIASPVKNQENSYLILFEDTTTQTQAGHNNALLYRLSLLLASTDQPLVDKLQAALDQILFEYPAHDCSVFLLNPIEKMLEQVAWGTTNLTLSKAVKHVQFKLGEGIVGHVAKTIRPIVIPDVLHEPRFVRPSPEQKNLTLLGVPLVNQGKLYGAITITRPIGQSFSDQDVQLFSTIANRLAIVVETHQIEEANKESTEALRNEQKKLQQIKDNLRDGIILYTTDMRFSMYNEAAIRILGIKKDLTGLTWQEVLREKTKRYCKYELLRDFDPTKAVRAALSGRTLTGFGTVTSIPPKKLEITIGPVFDRQNKISGIMSHFRDITQVHDLQEKMAARLKQLTNLFKISSVTGFNVQQIVRRILSLTLQLLSVKSCQLLLINPDDKKLYIVESFGDRTLSEAVDAKTTRLIEQVSKTQQPKTTSIKLSAHQAVPILMVPVIGHHNSCIGVLVIADKEGARTFSKEDINLLTLVASRIAMKIDNARLVQQVEQDREKLAAIIDQSADGIVTVNAEGIVQIWNSALERITGIKEKEIMGKSFNHFNTVISSLESFTLNEPTELQIVNMQTKELVWVGISAAAIKVGREINGYVAIVRNISRRKALDQSKSEFVATASHELRSPITAIVGYLSMLKRGDAGKIINSQQAFFVDKAYQNAKRMVTLVEDLLTATRMEAGQVRYHIERIDLMTVLEGIVTDLRFKAEEKSITMTIDRSGAGSVYADRDGIHQVFTNILNNAIKYTPVCGKITISFSTATDQNYLTTTIHDTGVGIDPIDQEKIFDKFGRANNPLSVSAGGTGLGLYITKSIIQALGGKIWVKSKKDHGATFYISLPISQKNKERTT